ncbi:MAG: class I SAM-dependent methyltransferase [Bacteroidales bacterium]|nr:class I SAM-dependent methyltransferase [Bacteroidales bacterium]
MNNLLEKIEEGLVSDSNSRTFLLERMPKNSICAEVGTWKGDFSQRMIDETNPKKIYLIDPYMYVADYKYALYGGYSGSQEKMDEIYQSVVFRFSSMIERGQLEIIRKKSDEGLGSLIDNTLDWIYIDGNHTYEYVRNDLLGSWGKVKVGGFITGDDYGLPGWWNDGVKKAVDEFIDFKQNSIEIIAFIGAQFILKKIED